MDDFGPRLRRARRDLGLSQEAVSDGIVTASFLSLIETGKRTPSAAVARALAERVGIGVDAGGRVASGADRDFIAAMAAVRAGDLESAQSRLTGMGDQSPVRALVAAAIAERRGELQDAKRLLGMALENAPAAGEVRLEIAAALCRVAYNAGDIALAIDIGERTLVTADVASVRDEDLLVEIRATLSGVYCDAGNLARARELTEDDAAMSRTPWQRGTQLWARSVLAVVEGDPERADRLAAEALLTFRSADRPLSTARLQVNAAMLRLHLHGPASESVTTLLESAEATFRTLHSTFDLAGCLISRARLAAVRGERADAERCIAEALELVRDEGAGLRARIYASAGVTWLELGARTEADALLLDARHLLEEAGANRAAATTWRQLASAYEELGQLDLALACMKAATDLLGVPVNLAPQVRITI